MNSVGHMNAAGRPRGAETCVKGTQRADYTQGNHRHKQDVLEAGKRELPKSKSEGLRFSINNDWYLFKRFGEPGPVLSI